MPTMPATARIRAEIAEAVTHVEHAMTPDVAHIFYQIGTDWSDEWAIFFRIVLSDDAAGNRLRPVAKEVARRLDDALDFQELGLFAYHNFRSESEQAALRRDVWS